MARVPTGGSRRAAEATLNRPRAVRKQKEYKVVLEAVTEKKRKLHSVLTFQDQAPLGFGFIPVGFGQVTEWCKEQCRQRGKEVHIVSNANFNRADPEKISSHVHRIGHHFPLDIIELACRKFGYRFSPYNGLEKIESQAQTQKYGVDYFERRLAAYYKKQQLSGFDDDTETKSYISGAIRELFPKIPQADLTSIVNHAFKEGTDRVGNAPELSLARRVQLAVVAHIRHTYTDYDEILKKESWIEARQKVELPSLAKLKEWRDEDDEDSNEMEETFREIIVIDDNEDESSVIASTSRDPNVEERELSMEIVSSRATARDLQPEPVDRHQRYAPYSSREPTRTIFLAPMHSRPPLARPFTHPAERPSYFASSPVTYAAPRASVAGPPVDARPPPPFGADEPPRLGPDPVHYAPTRHVDSYVPVMHFASPSDPGRSIREPARAPRPTQVRGSDGRVYIVSN
ncbi:hypothetical protein CC80DRAFT_83074 [Byssothecium circinans]|uniref:DUF2293 domain-containing protein n=1 Tax=Byssothecium circinans TaxID=147558 RepID=A0A6A5TSR0_9PLEO|nr:hypothetical protein CC80DRAFT_83074 [Byssothecium circinans]